MQICTRTCAQVQSQSAIITVRIVATIILLLLCSDLQADDLPDRQVLSTLDENQDPGWRATRSVPVGSTQVSGLININNATAEELANALPGIGPGKAQRIVDWRRENGAFQYLEQLLEVSGIGPKTLERITPFIHFGDSSEAVSARPLSDRSSRQRWVLLDIVDRANKDARQALRGLKGG